jgi:chemotaxis response regulator CheB
MANCDVVAVGTAAGGVEARLFLAKHLPREFPASILVTIHLPRHARSSLDQLLGRAGPLPAVFAGDGEMARKGNVYIAPPDRQSAARSGSPPKRSAHSAPPSERRAYAIMWLLRGARHRAGRFGPDLSARNDSSIPLAR